MARWNGEAPSNSDKVIDSRDVIGRIAQLEEEREDLDTALTEATEAKDEVIAEDAAEPTADLDEAIEKAREALTAWDEEYGDELKALKEFESEAEGYAEDWRHGASLIRDSYFEDYAREWADDLHGNEMRQASWPFDCIDWERAADALKQDYTSADFDGVTYWVR